MQCFRFKEEGEEIIEEHLDFEALDDNDFSEVSVPFEYENEDVLPTEASTFKIGIVSAGTEPSFVEPTFDGHWSSDEDYVDETYEAVSKHSPKKKKNAGSRSTFWSHKSRSLAGKIACKYCDTVFSSKAEQTIHACKYLKCDPRNFICRICGKELSKKTFSNHLHETLDCQYCGKQFVNPRNMKGHIEKQHAGEKFIPPKIKTSEEIMKRAECGDVGQSTEAKSKPSRYMKTKKRYECGKSCNDI